MSARLIRRFTEILGLVDRTFEPKCDAAVRELVEALDELPTEKGKGSITVTLDFDFEKGLFNVTPSVKTKLPEGRKFGRTPFWSHEGALSTQHPSQIDMFAPRQVDVKPQTETTAQSG